MNTNNTLQVIGWVMMVARVAILLFVLFTPRIMSPHAGAPADEARIQVAAFHEALDRVYSQTGGYSDSKTWVKALSVDPNPSESSKWRGPYVEDPKKRDPWGQPYHFSYSHNNNRNGGPLPDVWSSGTDRISGTDDDIGNWLLTRNNLAPHGQFGKE